MKRIWLVIATMMLSTVAWANGNENGCQGNCPQGGGTATATATAVQGQIQGQVQGQKQIQGQGQGQAQSIGDITAGGGGSSNSSVDVKTKAYGAGSTGLTGTATCLGSFSVGWNAIASTFIVKHCVLMQYADKFCGKDIACWRRVALVDENLTDEERTALGIAKPVSMPAASNKAANAEEAITPREEKKFDVSWYGS